MKIIADENIPFLKGVFEKVADIKYLSGGAIKKEDIADVDAMIIRTRTCCNQELLEDSSIKFIATATIGADHLDISWLEQVGIKWSNAQGCNSGAVCQYIESVLSLLINEGIKPTNTTIGIVGVGSVGSKVEKLAKKLNFNVLLNDPPRARKESNLCFVDLQTLLKQSDIITFHTPLTFEGIDATFRLFNFNSLELLKPKAIIINTSRGDVVHSQALIKGLDSDKISRVVLDVWENEPNISKELLKKVWIATPHIAGYSYEGKANATAMSVQAISRFFNLGLDNWQPQLSSKIDFKVYNVMDDDAKLRKNPEDFEKIRDNYPMRREENLNKQKMTN